MATLATVQLPMLPSNIFEGPRHSILFEHALYDLDKRGVVQICMCDHLGCLGQKYLAQLVYDYNIDFVRVDCRVADELMPYNLSENFEFLQRLTFDSCPFTDSCISQFVSHKALEELQLFSCYNVTGLFFNSLNLSKLKCLVLEMCRGLKIDYLLPAVDRLGELTKLTLAYIPYEILEEMQLILDKMPKLEWLDLYDDLRMSCHSSEPLSGLTRLKHLNVSCQLDDNDVEAVTRCCKELLTLDLQDCQCMSSHGVEALCRHAGARLTALSLGKFYEAGDDDVVALVRGCPNLTMLEVEANNERGILYYLNEDCWRAVLQYVPVLDLIRTERASRRWQQLVLTYLQGVHITIVDRKTNNPNACELELAENTLKSFENWTQKLGPSVVAAYCNSLESLEIINKNCPNIEAFKMLEAEVNNERGILDYLNEDCWRAVLQYVPVRDLIRTERASRRWQGVVLTYLQGVHITIMEDETNNPTACKLELAENRLKSFESWTQKLGPSVVSTYCNSLESLDIIKKYCPNIQALKFVNVDIHLPDVMLPFNLHEHFKFVQQVSFNYCSITDPCVSQFLADKALEGLELVACNNVTGRFFNSIYLSNIKSLILHSCGELKPEYVLQVINHLGELTKLTMADIPYEILEEIQLILDQMPKLEWLHLYHDVGISCHSSEPLSRLTRLKHLDVSCQLEDKDVEAVTRCCKDLQTLNFRDCQAMTQYSMEALCRHAGARLTSLTLARFYDAEDDDVVTLVGGCPCLTCLVISGAGALTPALVARAAAARRAVSPGRRLRLDLSNTNLADDDYLDEVKGQYEKIRRTTYEDLSLILD